MIEPRKVRILKWLLAFVLRRLSFELYFIALPKALVHNAKETTKWAKQRYPEFGGEALRHYVYGDLQKRYPEYTKKQVAQAIEVALL